MQDLSSNPTYSASFQLEPVTAAPRIAAPTQSLVRGIPLPPIPRVGRPRKYLIREMQIGDSFFIPRVDGMGEKPLRSAKSAARAQSKRLPGGVRRFAFRQVSNGWRCWRVA